MAGSTDGRAQAAIHIRRTKNAGCPCILDRKRTKLPVIRYNIITVLWLLALASLLLACSPSATPTVAPAAATAPPPNASDPFTTLIGTRCAFAGTGATLGFHDKRLNFTCPPDGDYETGLLGDVELSDRGWEIERAVFEQTDDGFSLVSSDMAVVNQIELQDGTLCAFAGTGATMGFDGKRLNFTCSPPADTFTGLLGDVQLGDEGWEIERAEIARSATGFSLESSEMALIAALVIE